MGEGTKGQRVKTMRVLFPLSLSPLIRHPPFTPAFA